MNHKETDLVNESLRILQESEYELNPLEEARYTEKYKYHSLRELVDKIKQNEDQIPPRAMNIIRKMDQRDVEYLGSEVVGTTPDDVLNAWRNISHYNALAIHYVRAFLRLSKRWKTPEAKEIKAELKKRIKKFYKSEFSDEKVYSFSY